MSPTMNVSPNVGEPKTAREELLEPRRQAESEKTTFARCECYRCKGGIEFESSAFQEKFRTNLAIFGQGVQCPHCGRITSIYLNHKPVKVVAASISKT